MMRGSRAILAGLAAVVGSVACGPSARAQAPGLGLSLGGYGATAGGGAMGSGMSGMAAGSVVPFGGRFATTMPSGGMGGGGLSFRPRPGAMGGGPRTPFAIGSMGGGASGMGRSPVSRPFRLPDIGAGGGLGLRGGMPRSMPGATELGVTPPSFGYPFRQPPSLVAPSAVPGMSM